jgi:hypothetical protein
LEGYQCVCHAINPQQSPPLDFAIVVSLEHRVGAFLQIGIRSIDRNIAVSGPGRTT